jgi:hypothetical protein
VISIIVALLRFAGRLCFAVSDEIDRALSGYRVEVPTEVPAWMLEDYR